MYVCMDGLWFICKKNGLKIKVDGSSPSSLVYNGGGFSRLILIYEKIKLSDESSVLTVDWVLCAAAPYRLHASKYLRSFSYAHSLGSLDFLVTLAEGVEQGATAFKRLII